MRKVTFLGAVVIAQILAVGCGLQRRSAEPLPLVCAHAHNDYKHTRPLYDALNRGFCNVEADIYLIDGELLVAHDREEVQPGRTLQTMYLRPLRELMRKNGGRVYRNGPEFTLLVDVKSKAEKTYAVLHKVLKRYEEMLTVVRAGKEEPGAVRVIISGNRAPEMMERKVIRYAGLDGRLEDLDSDKPAHLIPWISDNAARISKWKGVGPLPEADRKKISKIVKRAHQKGRKVRLWGTAELPAVWQALQQCGVDIIGADDIGALEQFLRENQGCRPQ